jgi:hypothetical protein
MKGTPSSFSLEHMSMKISLFKNTKKTLRIPYLCDYLFHESITIRGCTDNADEIDLMASDRQRFFILADAVDLKLQNLTLNAQYHTEGAICIRGGSVTLDNVIIRTDEVTRGVVIHPYSICKMTDCEVEGRHDISVEIKEGAVLEKKGNNKFSVEPAIRKIRAPGLRFTSLANNYLHFQSSSM